MRVLLLGGTTESRELAEALAATPDGIEVVLSLAGRTRAPTPGPAQVRSGGFGGRAGLAAYLRAEAIDALVDATHPFAAGITANAHAAAADAHVPLLRLARPQWVPQPGDRWTNVPDMTAAVAQVDALGGRVFLTVGLKDLMQFASCSRTYFLVRLIEPPAQPLPFADHTLVLERGPFTLSDETALMRRHRITVLVTKNSGGAATRAKLDAARALDLPVIMVDRPAEPAADRVDTVSGALDWVMDKRRHRP